MTDSPCSRQQNIVVQELPNEILIYDLKIDKAYCLNQMAGLVFGFCDGQRTVAEISDLMSQKLKTTVSEELVRLAVNDLGKNNLIENAEYSSIYLMGYSRRELVKKVGLASMVALPIISSIVAPTPAMAASGGGTQALLSSCVVTTDCVSGLTCRTCLGGTLCPAPPGPGIKLCCSGSGVGPGTFLGCSLNSPACDLQAVNCCTNAVTFTVTNCTSAGSGSCNCA